MEKTVFEADASFIITGRGLALTGVIISGVIHHGDFIVINKGDQILQREITRIELVRATAGGNIGILVRCERKDEMKKLRSWDWKGKRFEVVKA